MGPITSGCYSRRSPLDGNSAEGASRVRNVSCWRTWLLNYEWCETIESQGSVVRSFCHSTAEPKHRRTGGTLSSNNGSDSTPATKLRIDAISLDSECPVSRLI